MFSNSSRPGSTFDGRINQIALKTTEQQNPNQNQNKSKAEGSLKLHEVVYTQTCLIEWTDHIWQKVTEQSVRPMLGKGVRWLILGDSFLAHSLKTQCPLDAESCLAVRNVCALLLVWMGSVPKEGWISSWPMSDTLVGWVKWVSDVSWDGTNKRSIKATI